MAAPIVHINSFSSFDHVPRSGLQVWGTHILAGLGPQFTRWTFRLGHLNGGGLGKPTQIDRTSQLRSPSCPVKCKMLRLLPLCYGFGYMTSAAIRTNPDRPAKNTPAYSGLKSVHPK